MRQIVFIARKRRVVAQCSCRLHWRALPIASLIRVRGSQIFHYPVIIIFLFLLHFFALLFALLSAFLFCSWLRFVLLSVPISLYVPLCCGNYYCSSTRDGHRHSDDNAEHPWAAKDYAQRLFRRPTVPRLIQLFLGNASPGQHETTHEGNDRTILSHPPQPKVCRVQLHAQVQMEAATPTPVTAAIPRAR